jgi:hypothetical protein
VSKAIIICNTIEHSGKFNRKRTQPTAHSHSTVKCNLSVTITKSSPWRWASRVETCRSVLQLIIKLSLCICWWLVFLYDIVHGHGHTLYCYICLDTGNRGIQLIQSWVRYSLFRMASYSTRFGSSHISLLKEFEHSCRDAPPRMLINAYI